MNHAKRHVCIVGLGFFGASLARALAREAEVLAIDKEITRVNAISDHVQRALCIDVRDFDALSSAVTPDFDEAVVAIGEQLESSILCTLYLKRIGIPLIRAKASSEEHSEILRSIGASQVIFPERETAERLAMKIHNPNLLDFIPLTQEYQIIEMETPPGFHGQSLEGLNLRKSYDVFVLAIRSKQKQDFIFLPGPAGVVQKGDVLVIIGKAERIRSLQNAIQES